MVTEYTCEPGDGTPWREIEAARARQFYRELAIQLGDNWTELARAWIHNTRVGGGPNLRYANKAAALLLRACNQFQIAGLSGRAARRWRYALLLQRAATRGAA